MAMLHVDSKYMDSRLGILGLLMFLEVFTGQRPIGWQSRARSKRRSGWPGSAKHDRIYGPLLQGSPAQWPTPASDDVTLI